MSSAKSILSDVWLTSATATQERSEPESYQADAAGEKRTAKHQGIRNALEYSKASKLKSIGQFSFSKYQSSERIFNLTNFALAKLI